jgi:hypothetical protein
MPQWLAASFGTYGVPPRPDIRGHAGLCISLQGRRVQSAPSPKEAGSRREYTAPGSCLLTSAAGASVL